MFNFKNYDLMAFQIAVGNLRPGLVKYVGDSYDSVIWLTDDVPSEEEVVSEANSVKDVLLFADLRVERNRLLFESDWTQVADAPVDADVWAEYRQLLRDLPKNTTDPENPVWPTRPE